jgi:hypothetical protein
MRAGGSKDHTIIADPDPDAYSDTDPDADPDPDPDPDWRFVRGSLEQLHRIRCGGRSLLQRRQLDRKPVELRRGARRRLRRLERKRFLLIS